MDRSMGHITCYSNGLIMGDRLVWLQACIEASYARNSEEEGYPRFEQKNFSFFHCSLSSFLLRQTTMQTRASLKRKTPKAPQSTGTASLCLVEPVFQLLFVCF